METLRGKPKLGSNQYFNKQARAVAKALKLNAAEEQKLHKWISHQGLHSYLQVMEAAAELFPLKFH